MMRVLLSKWVLCVLAVLILLYIGITRSSTVFPDWLEGSIYFNVCTTDVYERETMIKLDLDTNSVTSIDIPSGASIIRNSSDAEMIVATFQENNGTKKLEEGHFLNDTCKYDHVCLKLDTIPDSDTYDEWVDICTNSAYKMHDEGMVVDGAIIDILGISGESHLYVLRYAAMNDELVVQLAKVSNGTGYGGEYDDSVHGDVYHTFIEGDTDWKDMQVRISENGKIAWMPAGNDYIAISDVGITKIKKHSYNNGMCCEAMCWIDNDRVLYFCFDPRQEGYYDDDCTERSVLTILDANTMETTIYETQMGQKVSFNTPFVTDMTLNPDKTQLIVNYTDWHTSADMIGVVDLVSGERFDYQIGKHEHHDIETGVYYFTGATDDDVEFYETNYETDTRLFWVD